jgi:outer membrane protein OmpA-like peptidoglycan-associated protein
MNHIIKMTIVFILLPLITSCTFNPFTTDNKLTGLKSPEAPLAIAGGAAAGGTLAWLFGGSKTVIGASALGGGLVGYYVSTLRFASGGIMKSGGQVFALGDSVSVEIPTDRLFDVNSADFLDDAAPILDSAVNVLKRYPDNNIMISGSTSGFGSTKFQLKLSEARARQVSAYLWAHGVSQFKQFSTKTRQLIYTGYGDFFPIANDIHNDSNRKNSRIQITAYPSKSQLKIDRCFRVFSNVGASDSDPCLGQDSVGYKDQPFNKVQQSPYTESDPFNDSTPSGKVNNSISSSSPSTASMQHNFVKDEDVWGEYSAYT